MKQHTIGARILAALLPLVCAAGFAMPAAADIPPALENATLLMSKVGSYHVTMTETAGGHTITSAGDVASLTPLKMHLTMGGGSIGTMEMIVLAPDAYMKQGSASWRKFPGNMSSFTQMDVATQFSKEKANFTVTDLGMQTKDGQLLHAFKAVNSVHNTTQMIYLDGAGRIARLEAGPMVMQFSKYGEAVTIAPPM